MFVTHTEADFDYLSWHDCRVWGFEIGGGDFDEGYWTSDLVLKLDYIVEWSCPAECHVAPATLVFHGVTDLRFNIDMGGCRFQHALQEISIFDIKRERLHNQLVHLDRPYYVWTIQSDFPRTSEISFGAYGFTQTLHTEPLVTHRPYLSPTERKRLLQQ